MPDSMGHKAEAQRAGEGHDLGGEHRVGAGAAGYQHAGVVDHAGPCRAVHEAGRLEQKLLGLEAGKTRGM
jgi:hypothetical protein